MRRRRGYAGRWTAATAAEVNPQLTCSLLSFSARYGEGLPVFLFLLAPGAKGMGRMCGSH
jgi:hypothetical protein